MIKDYLTPRTVELKFATHQMLCASTKEIETEEFTIVDSEFEWN